MVLLTTMLVIAITMQSIQGVSICPQIHFLLYEFVGIYQIYLNYCAKFIESTTNALLQDGRYLDDVFSNDFALCIGL